MFPVWHQASIWITLIQWWFIVNWVLGNKLKWNINWYLNRFIVENGFQKVICKLAATLFVLTRWGWVMHICVGNLAIMVSDNGLLPGRHQAIIWTNDGISLISNLRNKLQWNLRSEFCTFSLRKRHLIMPSAEWRPFCHGLNALKSLMFIGPHYNGTWLHYYRLTSNIRCIIVNSQCDCWSIRCSWSIACRHCSNYIFILDLKPSFNGLGKANKARWETFQFGYLVHLILEVWWYLARLWAYGVLNVFPFFRWYPGMLGRTVIHYEYIGYKPQTAKGTWKHKTQKKFKSKCCKISQDQVSMWMMSTTGAPFFTDMV